MFVAIKQLKMATEARVIAASCFTEFSTWGMTTDSKVKERIKYTTVYSDIR